MGGTEIKYTGDELIPVCGHLGNSKKAIQPSDSDVFRLGDSCLKLYYVNPNLARIYGRMQYLLSGHTGHLKNGYRIPASVLFGEGRYSSHNVIQSVRFRCINELPKETAVPDYANYGVKIAVTLPFIEGRTLHDVYWEICDNNVLADFICGTGWMKDMQNFYSELGVNLQHKYPDLNQLAGINIKVRGYDEETGELELVITDIAADIEFFVRNNIHLLQ